MRKEASVSSPTAAGFIRIEMMMAKSAAFLYVVDKWTVIAVAAAARNSWVKVDAGFLVDKGLFWDVH